MQIRGYQPADYKQLKALHLDSSTFGGQFDEARDSEERLNKKTETDPDAILVAVDDNQLLGSISLIDDGRVAWLFRFTVKDNDINVAQELKNEATAILKKRGHTQVLVYTPVGNSVLDSRYVELGFTKGYDYTCYWQEV